MKKHRSLPGFLAGMAAAFLLCCTAVTALAASGTVSFNTAHVSVNHNRILWRNKDLTTDAGAAIPSTILYTDEQGGTTNYVPIRYFAQAIGLPVEWNSVLQTVEVTVPDELALHLLPLSDPGCSWNGLYEEVDPIPAPEGKTLLSADCQQQEAFTRSLSPNPAEGDYVSITITNNGPAPIQFSLGMLTGTAAITSPTQVPAGTTVTRTVKLLTDEGLTDHPLYLELDNARNVLRTIDAGISAVQFTA